MDAFNLIALRRLYNRDNSGRGEIGRKTRERLHTTITYSTFLGLTKVVSVQKGGYGAPVVELAIRILLALIGSLDTSTVAEELLHATIPVKITVVEKLRAMADYIEKYSVKN